MQKIDKFIYIQNLHTEANRLPVAVKTIFKYVRWSSWKLKINIHV